MYNNIMNILANLISLFHGLVVVFVILGSFSNNIGKLLLHATFCLSLLVHWWGNSNLCSLSVLESHLRGLDYTQSFTHQFIAPVYDISQSSWSKVCTLFTMTVMMVSMYKLYQSNFITVCWNQYKSNIITMLHCIFNSDNKVELNLN